MTRCVCGPADTLRARVWPSGLLGEVTSSSTGRAAVGTGGVALTTHSKRRVSKVCAGST